MPCGCGGVRRITQQSPAVNAQSRPVAHPSVPTATQTQKSAEIILKNFGLTSLKK